MPEQILRQQKIPCHHEEKGTAVLAITLVKMKSVFVLISARGDVWIAVTINAAIILNWSSLVNRSLWFLGCIFSLCAIYSLTFPVLLLSQTSASFRMVEIISSNEIPAALNIPGNLLCSVKPGIVLTSLKTISLSFVKNISTRANPLQSKAL